MIQMVILMASIYDEVTIPPKRSQYTHCCINIGDYTAIKECFFLTYTEENLYLLRLLYQDILQGHIIEISYPNTPIVMLTRQYRHAKRNDVITLYDIVNFYTVIIYWII